MNKIWRISLYFKLYFSGILALTLFNNFMDQFKDNEIEEKLEIDVINKYFELIKQ